LGGIFLSRPGFDKLAAVAFQCSLVRLLALLVALGFFSQAEPAPKPTALPSEKLHNLFKVDGQIYSGSSPNDEAAFVELKKLGVTTVISVDGSKPNVELARKHGLKYVHLPIGYDGVPAGRIAELVKAAGAASGPIYVHCHHGKHRGPSAVAVICEGLKGWSPEGAVEWLKQAGTANDYSGLYRDVREFKAPDAVALSKIKELSEVAPTAPLVDVMVSIDERFDALRAIQRAGWKDTTSKEASSAFQQATLLWEHYREIARMEDAAKRPDDYRTKLTEAENSVEALRTALRVASPKGPNLDIAVKGIGQQCASCHKAYRNKK
jgi:protein tyrosine phosphatase (PTP) superfamily phosphohydrolase (DUF442 family)